MPSRLRSWLRTILRRARVEGEMREEIEFHITARAEDLMRTGLPSAEAFRRARLEFGGVEGWKERCREARGAALADEMTRNLRDAWRSARRSPGFALVAVLSLALGIGANVAAFGLARELLLSPLPVRDPGGLHQVVLSTTRRPYYRVPYPKFATLRDEFAIFETLFGWGNLFPDKMEIVREGAGGAATQGRVTVVTGSFFEGLGLRPAVGRLIEPDDDRPGGPASVAVLSFGAWQALFAGDPDVVGRRIRVRDRPGDLVVDVIGVAPEQFEGPEPAVPSHVYLPVHALQPTRPNMISGAGMMWMHVMGRLKPGVPVDTAADVLREGWSRIDREAQARRGDNTRPEYFVLEDGSHGYSSVRTEFSRPLLILLGLVLVVFLIACANLASLLFVRASRRSGELALRVALGAGRGTIVRQWLTECVLLALVGGAAGIVAARWITGVLLLFVPEADREALRFDLNADTIVFATLLSVAAASLFGWIPTRRASRVAASEVLRAHAPGIATRSSRAARVLLSGQLAASLILIVGALLFARTLWNMNSRPTGFDRERVLYARLQFFLVPNYPRERVPAIMREVIPRLQNSPLLESVAVGSIPSGGAGGWGWARVPGYTFAPNEENVVYHYYVSPDYFRTMSIPFVEGRDFTEADATTKPAPLIVSERLARHYFSGRSALGQKIVLGPNPPAEIVGVVRDIIDTDLRTPANELVYHPVSRFSWGDVVVRVAAGVDLSLAEAELRRVLTAGAGDVPIVTGPAEGVIQESLQRDRLIAQLSAVLGLAGMLLASIGLFGAVAHWASGRRREIGIRMMLGATRSHIAWVVLRQGLAVTVLGLLAGVPLALAVAALLRPMLFGVAPDDVATHATAAVLLIVAGLLAACWPAWRAARVNPLEALRQD